MWTSACTLSCIVLLVCRVQSFGLIGGFSDIPLTVNEKIKSYVQTIRTAIVDDLKCRGALTDHQHVSLTPLQYKQQLVNGMNYIVKIRADDGTKSSPVLVKFYMPFGGVPSFIGLHELSDTSSNTLLKYTDYTYKKCEANTV